MLKWVMFKYRFDHRLAAIFSLALVCLLAGCIASNSSPPGQAGKSPNQTTGLSGLHRALSALEAGRVERVNIVQFGDSHTAGDHFSGRLRDLFQARFGNAGRGMLPPGSPFPYWRPYQVEVVQRGNWEILSSNRTDYPNVPFGMSGFIIRSHDRNSTIRLTANADGAFDTVEVGFFHQPSGGRFDVLVGGSRVGEVDTRGAAFQLDRKTFQVAHDSSTFEIRPQGNGSVDIADWSVYRRERGVTLSGQGFVGAQINIMERWDTANVANELKQLSPALIILAFGTNEGFDSPDRLADYASVFEARVDQLHEIVPAASIVIVGPPDADRLPDYCGVHGPAREQLRCAPLTADERADYSRLLARRDRRLCRWHAPAGIVLVRQQQQQIAAKTGAVFWDWSSVQGGECGANRWAHEGLGRDDRVHMTEGGYEMSADKLFDVLMQGYRR